MPLLALCCGPAARLPEGKVWSSSRHRLYKKFWRSLEDLALWRDEDYQRLKSARALREIMPECVIMVRQEEMAHVILQQSLCPTGG